MRISINSYGISDFRFPEQGINDIRKSEFENVYINLDGLYLGPFKSIKDRNDEFLKGIKYEAELISFFRKVYSCQMRISAVHSPVLKTNEYGDEFRKLYHDLSLKTIRSIKEINCRYVVIPALPDDNGRFRLSDENRGHFLSLADDAKKSEVTLLIENCCNYYNGHYVRSDYSDARKLKKFVATLNRTVGTELFGIVMDSGNCSLCGADMKEFITVSGEAIKVVLIRENDGVNDVSMLPFTSVNQGVKTDWLGLVRGLRSIDFDGDMIYDIADTAAAFSPLLKPHLLELVKATADYFKWQIEIEKILKKHEKRVLFGAGNMCNKYMKCYGTKYPPLFTCDNNSKRWGDTICGLEIKNPEELKSLPEGCAVIICNLYYREIEEQIRKMGIKNPVEFFNDEYLPEYPFEWLEV